MSLLKIISSYNLKTWTFPMVLFVLYGFLTYGNYGYLRYSVGGGMTNSFLSNLVFLRFPISLLLASSFVYNSSDNKKNNFLIFKRFWDVLLLFVWLIINSLLTQKFIYPIWFILTFIGFIKLFIHTRKISSNYYEFIIRGLTIILSAYIFGTILAVFSLPKLVLGSEDIYFSSKTHYTYCVMVVASLISVINSIKKKKISPLEWAFVVCCLIVLLFSGRRTPTIVLCINVCVYFFYNRKIIIPIIIVLNVFFIGYDLGDFKTVQRLDRIDYSSNTLDDSSYNERLRLREYYLNKVEDTGYVGVGLGRIDAEDIYSEKLGTHNTYLSVYHQLGIIGIILWLVIIIKSIYRVLRNSDHKLKIIFLMLFLPFFAIGWVENTFNPGQIMFQYNVGILILARLLN